MGVLDLFGKECQCPVCGREGARKTFGKVKCRNSQCPNFDVEFSQSAAPVPEPESAAPIPVDTRDLSGHFDPGTYTVEIRYRNSRGQNRIYTGDARTLRESGEHISLLLVPTGRRVAFAKKRIQNLSDISVHPSSPLSGPKPTARESRVLRFHSRRGSTSALYESLRRKYPNYE